MIVSVELTKEELEQRESYNKLKNDWEMIKNSEQKSNLVVLVDALATLCKEGDNMVLMRVAELSVEFPVEYNALLLSLITANNNKFPKMIKQSCPYLYKSLSARLFGVMV